MKDKMIYISSPSYSGSTLLTILLAEHPGTASIGELKASAFGDLEQYLCSCGERLLDCGFWLELERRVKARVGSFDLRTWGTHFAGGGPITNKLLAATLRGARFETLRKLATTLLPPVRGRFRQIMALNEAVIDCALEMAGVHAFIEGSKDPIRAKYLYENGLLGFVRRGFDSRWTWRNKLVHAPRRCFHGFGARTMDAENAGDRATQRCAR